MVGKLLIVLDGMDLHSFEEERMGVSDDLICFCCKLNWCHFSAKPENHDPGGPETWYHSFYYLAMFFVVHIVYYVTGQILNVLNSFARSLIFSYNSCMFFLFFCEVNWCHIASQPNPRTMIRADLRLGIIHFTTSLCFFSFFFVVHIVYYVTGQIFDVLNSFVRSLIFFIW